MCALTAPDHVEEACFEKIKSTKAESAKQAYNTLLEYLSTAEVVEAFKKWKVQKSKSIMNYLRGNHPALYCGFQTYKCFTLSQAAEAISKLFLGFDRIKYMYKRLWSRYITDMYDTKTKHPGTW